MKSVEPEGVEVPLEVAILEALEYNALEFEKARLRGTWRSPSFSFTSRLKRHPALESASADEATACIRPHLERLPDAGHSPWSVLGHTDTRGREVGDLEADFMAGWIKYVPHPLEEALRRAEACPVRDTWLDRQSPGLRLFTSVVAHRNESKPGTSIHIGVAAFGDALGCDGKSISNYKRILLSRAWLRLESEHSHGKGKAAEYTYHGPPPRLACRTCEGSGLVHDGWANPRKTCPACDGEGQV